MGFRSLIGGKTTVRRRRRRPLSTKTRIAMRFGLLIGIAGSIVAFSAIESLATINPPSGFIVIDGSIRAHPPGNDWGNSGIAYDTTTCAGGAIHAVGTNGIFDCGAVNP